MALKNISLFILLSLILYGGQASGKTFDLSLATIRDINDAFDAGILNSEKFVGLYLDRIEAYDKAGPNLNAVIMLNPQAINRAKTLDAERKRSGRRSLLHGIPVVLKDNFDTADMPTTAGSYMLRGSMPPNDAYVVKKLREAGAIILAKVNMGEFADGSMSSLIGDTRNPHNLERTPGGSSSGTGVAIAAVYASLGLGTDTGGSVRVPSSANGIVGLKTTHGLLSRDGVIPMVLSLDAVGPMARNVYDVAVALGVMTGIDPADETTRKSKSKFKKDYTRYLDVSALQGARIGIARDFLGQDSEVDGVVDTAIEVIKNAGATVVDINFPGWFLNSHVNMVRPLRWTEFKTQIEDYLATLKEPYPKTLAELVERSMKLTAADNKDMVPNPNRWAMFKQEMGGDSVDDYQYKAIYNHALPLIQSIVKGAMMADNLEAIVYPTLSGIPSLIDPAPNLNSTVNYKYALLLANITGFPDLTVPAGFTNKGMPVTLSFLGLAFSEARLLSLGYAFEQKIKARRLPAITPSLPGEIIDY